MTRRGFLAAAALAAGAGWSAGLASGAAFAGDGKYRLSGPYVHKNLAIYLIHRSVGRDGPVPLTLSEAMGAGVLTVKETGRVDRLVIRNDGDREVFIQAGDIVKGGKQDRVLTISMIVRPKSGDIPIGAFCVERGRWAKRGTEKLSAFSASSARMPSKAGKLAMMERATRTAPRRQPHVLRQALTGLARHHVQRRAGPSRQGEVWESVRKMQKKLARNAKVDVVDKRSRSSLQLSLENRRLKAAVKVYRQALGGVLEKHPDAVGYVFAINGTINSGDEFGSAGLFRKLWLRQLTATATEAIAEKAGPAGNLPTLADVEAFLANARAAKPAWKPMPGSMGLETRDSTAALYTEARRRNGKWVHRSFIAR